MSDLAYKGIPSRVRIGCYTFQVEVGESDDHEAEGTFGHMNPISQKIRLRPGMGNQNLANTFIHEVIHGLNWFSGAGQNVDTYRDIEEDFTTKIANSMCAFWQDNPKAMSWWANLNAGTQEFPESVEVERKAKK